MLGSWTSWPMQHQFAEHRGFHGIALVCVVRSTGTPCIRSPALSLASWMGQDIRQQLSMHAACMSCTACRAMWRSAGDCSTPHCLSATLLPVPRHSFSQQQGEVSYKSNFHRCTTVFRCNCMGAEGCGTAPRRHGHGRA